jgi:hypothetical protein
VPASNNSDELSNDAVASPGRRHPVSTIKQAPANASVTIGTVVALANTTMPTIMISAYQRLPVRSIERPTPSVTSSRFVSQAD